MSTSTLPRFTPFLFAALLLTGLFFGLRQAQPVYAADTDIRINEFMASNQTTLADEDGAYWLELYNAGVDPVDLTGWYLTDNALQKNKWQMPAVTLNPGGYLVIFASGKNRSVVGNPLHTNFSLSAAGEYLGLIKPDGTTVIDEYAPTFPAMAARSGVWGDCPRRARLSFHGHPRGHQRHGRAPCHHLGRVGFVHHLGQCHPLLPPI